MAKPKKETVTEEDKKRTHERITQIINQVSLLARVAIIGTFVFLTAKAVFSGQLRFRPGRKRQSRWFRA